MKRKKIKVTDEMYKKIDEEWKKQVSVEERTNDDNIAVRKLWLRWRRKNIKIHIKLFRFSSISTFHLSRFRSLFSEMFIFFFVEIISHSEFVRSFKQFFIHFIYTRYHLFNGKVYVSYFHSLLKYLYT